MPELEHRPLAVMIRQLRNQVKMTQTHLAEIVAAGVAGDKSQVSDWERGRVTPRADTVRRIAEALQHESGPLLQAWAAQSLLLLKERAGSELVDMVADLVHNLSDKLWYILDELPVEIQEAMVTDGRSVKAHLDELKKQVAVLTELFPAPATNDPLPVQWRLADGPMFTEATDPIVWLNDRGLIDDTQAKELRRDRGRALALQETREDLITALAIKLDLTSEAIQKSIEALSIRRKDNKW